MARSDRMVFRLPVVSVIFPILLFICATPLATFKPWLLWVYLAPVLGLAWVLVTSTVVTPNALQARTLLRRTRIAWSELDGFEFRGTRWAVAVSLGGRRTRLPMVRPRDLPALAEVSGGRLRLGDDAPAEPAEPAESAESAESAEPTGPAADVPDQVSDVPAPDPSADPSADPAGTTGARE